MDAAADSTTGKTTAKWSAGSVAAACHDALVLRVSLVAGGSRYGELLLQLSIP